MPDHVFRYACLGFAVMLVTVAANMLLMQPQDGASSAGRSAAAGTGRASLEGGAADQTRHGPVAATNAQAAAASARGLWRSIQTGLARQGYRPGEATGLASLPTRAAILAYEYDHALPLTADASQELLQSLIFGLPRAPGKGSLTAGPAAREVVQTVQKALNQLGFATGQADGVLGPRTQRAIIAFERDRGLDVTGRISGRLIEALAAHDRVRDLTLAQSRRP